MSRFLMTHCVYTKMSSGGQFNASVVKSKVQ